MFSVILFCYNPFWYIPFMAIKHSKAYQEWVGKDENPPQVAITSPVEGQWVGKNFTVKGTASDAETGIQKVEVKIGDSSWKVASGTTNWSYSAQWGTNTESLQIQARSYDIAGNVSQTVSVTVKVDAEAPVIIVNESNSDPVIWNLYDIDGKHNISGTTTDSGGSGLLCTDFKLSGGQWKGSTSEESWSYSFDKSNFNYGKNELIVRARDKAGNESYVSRNISAYIARTWGGGSRDCARAMAIDSSGNIYVAGVTNSFGAGGYDAFILKLDSSGNVQWQKTWGGTNSDGACAITVDSSDNIYVAGYTWSFGAGNGDAFILKLDSSGNIQWQKTWGGANSDGACAITVDSSGNIYVAGLTGSFGAVKTDAFILKLDSSGNIQWQKIWGGSDNEEAYAIALDSSGNTYVAGYTKSFGAGSYDTFILKLDSSGNIQLQETWGGSDDDRARAIALDSFGNIHVAGYTKSFGAGGYDAFILKLGPSGNIKWQKTWGGSNDDYAYVIAVDSFENIYVIGETLSLGAGSDDAFILKLNASGTMQWQKTWGGTGSDYAYAIAVDSDGNFYISGYAPNNGGIWNEVSGSFGDASGSVSSPSGSSSSPSGSEGTPAATLQDASGTLDVGAGGDDVLVIKAAF